MPEKEPNLPKEIGANLSKESFQALSFAKEEALRFNHHYIGTEHILLGLVKEGSATEPLAKFGVTVEKVRTATEFIIGRGDTRPNPDDLSFTPRSKKVIELAMDEWKRDESSEITPDHLLVGIVREGEGLAAGVLESLGFDLRKLVVGRRKEEERELLQTVNRLKLFFKDPKFNHEVKKRVESIVSEVLSLTSKKPYS